MTGRPAPERALPPLTVAQLLNQGWSFSGSWLGPQGETLEVPPPSGGWSYDDAAKAWVPPPRRSAEEAGIAPLPPSFTKVQGKWVELTDFRCPVCSKGCPHYSALAKHWKIHLNDRRFTCECGKGFTDSTTLLGHRRRCRVALGG